MLAALGERTKQLSPTLRGIQELGELRVARAEPRHAGRQAATPAVTSR